MGFGEKYNPSRKFSFEDIEEQRRIFLWKVQRASEIIAQYRADGESKYYSDNAVNSNNFREVFDSLDLKVYADPENS